MRTLVDIPEDDIRWLDRMADERGLSRTAIVREAVAQMRSDTSRRAVDAYFGIWRDRVDIGDALKFVQRVRAGAARDVGGA